MTPCPLCEADDMEACACGWETIAEYAADEVTVALIERRLHTAQ
ncbi:MAG: hypothetical protein SCI25_00125 [Desulfuromonadales bacterium]|nr:hypothetical protein [Desulfuromonadales bacterium]